MCGGISVVVIADICGLRKTTDWAGGCLLGGVQTSIIVDTVDVFDFVRFVAVPQIEVHVYQGPEG